MKHASYATKAGGASAPTTHPNLSRPYTTLYVQSDEYSRPGSGVICHSLQATAWGGLEESRLLHRDSSLRSE